MCETVSGLSHFMLDHLHGLSTDLHDVAINHLHLFGAKKGSGALGIGVLLLSLTRSNHNFVRSVKGEKC